MKFSVEVPIKGVSTEELLEKKQELESYSKKLGNQNFFDRLGIPPNATEDEINGSLREKAFTFHPDNKPDELKEVCSKILALYNEARTALVYNIRQKHEDNLRPRTEAERPEKRYGTAGQMETIRAIRKIRESLSRYGLEGFLAERKRQVKTNAITEEEANRIAREYVFEWAQIAFDDGGEKSFYSTVNPWIKMKIFTEKDAESRLWTHKRMEEIKERLSG